MSDENVELVRAGYEPYTTTGELGQDYTDDFVWDVSNLHWPGQQVYKGADGHLAVMDRSSSMSGGLWGGGGAWPAEGAVTRETSWGRSS